MIRILLISDLHLIENGAPEDQGQILHAFVQDLDKTIDANNYSNNYCIVGGDLTMNGHKKSFEFFHKKIISPLLKFMPLENIFVTPGNHDLNRNIISQYKDSIDKFLEENNTEERFNDAIEKDKKHPLRGKFKSFIDYCKSSLNIPKFELEGYFVNPIPSVSICFINSALCSCGGLNGVNDSGSLRIYSRMVNKWIQENIGRKKILVMHHPISDLDYEYCTELTQLIESKIDICINGHTHFDKVNNIIVNNRQYLHFQTPQLFSSKKDNNGYAVLHLDTKTGQLKDIVFRQWIDRRKCFSNGVDYSDEGVFINTQFTINPQDDLEMRLEDRLKESMRSFNMLPTWRERYLDENSPSKQTAKSGDWDYIRILNSTDNFQICSAAQFGLTCYAQYLSLKAWQMQKKHWIYIDMQDIHPAQIDNLIDKAFEFHGLRSQTDVDCLILDNWPYCANYTNRLMSKIRKKIPECKIIFCVKSLDASIVDGLDPEIDVNFKLLYLRHLSRNDMRAIAQEVNAEKNFAEDNQILLERLVADLRDLNIHRTPFNCIQLLMALSKNYEERPINRTKVLDNIISLVFDNPGSLSYQSNLPDAETCKYIVGYFCEWLYRRQPFSVYFREEDFNIVCQEFCDREYHGSNPRNILRVFLNNQIVVIDQNGLMKFRFLHWMCYFASDRMKRNPNFLKYMIDNKMLFDPEIVDFYTATDRARTETIELLTQQLIELTENVRSAINMPVVDDPYICLKWAMNETREGITVDRLEEQISQSNLPDEIKDAIADRDYSSVKPYFQTINKFLDEYFVHNLIMLIHSGSIALRNSEFADPRNKNALSEAIFYGWNEIANVLFSIAPLMAKNGYSGIGGQRFTLEQGFPVDKFNECVKAIMICIPENIIRWFCGDIFNNKIAPLYYNYLSSSYPPLIRHFAALLIVHKRPYGYKEQITKYIHSLPKNSYYLGNLTECLNVQYVTEFMNKSDQRKTVELLSECYNNRGVSVNILVRDDRNIF